MSSRVLLVAAFFSLPFGVRRGGPPTRDGPVFGGEQGVPASSCRVCLLLAADVYRTTQSRTFPSRGREFAVGFLSPSLFARETPLLSWGCLLSPRRDRGWPSGAVYPPRPGRGTRRGFPHTDGRKGGVLSAGVSVPAGLLCAARRAPPFLLSQCRAVEHCYDSKRLASKQAQAKGSCGL